MDALPFAAGSPDAIWSEGAIYNMGFESGVRQWHRFLRAFVGYGYYVARRIEGAPQAGERDVLVTLIEAYENKHYDFGLADPVKAISQAPHGAGRPDASRSGCVRRHKTEASPLFMPPTLNSWTMPG